MGIKIKTFIAIMTALTLTACHPVKSGPGTSATETIVITSDNAEQMLNRLEMNLHELRMLDNDVVDNVDAIIAIHDKNNAIIQAIEADTLVLTPEQRARFSELKAKQ